MPLVLALMVQATAPGQAASPPPSPPDVIVERPSDKTRRQEIADLTAATPGFQIARWHDDLCLQVQGLDDVHRDVVASRLTAAAQPLGLRVSGRGCQTNVLVVFAGNSDTYTRTLLAEHPGMFADPLYGLGRQAARDALQKPRPVRWFTATRTSGADGMRINGSMQEGPYSGSTRVLQENPYSGGSRIHANTRENAFLSYVVVDDTRMTGVTWGQLGDYIAFVTLARPALTAQNGRSILSLFADRDAGRAGPSGLTGDDLSFLRYFYRSDGSLSVPLQRAQIQAEEKAGR